MKRQAATGAILIAAALAVIAQATSRTTWDGIYSRAQAERGRKLYGVYCLDCHGDELEGDVVEHPALAGGAFRDKWNGMTVGELFERVHRDMPMDNPGTLSRQKAVDLTAFLLAANDFPPGNEDLPADLPVLQQIRIESSRPARKK